MAEVLLREHFAIEAHLTSTRAADAYKAVDTRSNSAVILWKQRHPIAPDSELAQQFCARLEALREIDPPVVQLLSFGVDAEGIAYCMLPPLDALPIAARVPLEAPEAERRVMACLRIMDALHKKSIVCGDICASSFFQQRDGEVLFIGVMGSFDREATSTSAIPPLDTLHFVAPEQRSGVGLDLASDVYSLGVLIYFFFSGTYPHGRQPLVGATAAAIKPLTQINPRIPAWLDQIVLNCLADSSAQRYANASELLKAFVAGRSALSQPAKPPLLVERAMTVHAGSQLTLSKTFPGQGALTNQATSRAAAPAKLRSSMSRPMVVGSLGIVFLIVVYAALSMGSSPSGDGTSPEGERVVSHLGAAGNEGLREVIEQVGDQAATLEKKREQMQKLSASDDPLAHALLVQTAVDTSDSSLRSAAEEAILSRARRHGLVRVADQARQWFRLQGPAQDAEGKRVVATGYETFLKALDVTVPFDVRAGFLRELYPSNQRIILRIVAAFALDTQQYQEYQALLAPLVGDASALEDATKRSTLALILYQPELNLAFGDDAIQQLSHLPDQDVLWLLTVFAERNDVNVRALAQQALERSLLSPLRAWFASVIKEREHLSPDIVLSLVRASAGKVGKDDIGSLSAWYDETSERALLAICADTYPEDLLLEAFDVLAGKSLSLEPAKALIAWIRKQRWDDRQLFVRAVGVFGSLSVVGEEQAVEVLANLKQELSNTPIVRILINTQQTELVRLLAQRQSDILGLGTLLMLLSYPDIETKKAALFALRDTKELGALQIVLEAYKREKDPELRELYKQYFWAVRRQEESIR
jgi:hypothetical protein